MVKPLVMQEFIELAKLFGLDRAGMILMIGVLFRRLLQEIDRKETVLREILPLTSKMNTIIEGLLRWRETCPKGRGEGSGVRG